MRAALIPAFALFLAPLGVSAQEAKGPLAPLVQRPQSNPADAALRERIIKQARRMKRPPAIPEEAHKNYVEGETFVKAAKSPAGEALAIGSFQKALALAPWWGDAYYDLATAQELAGSYDDAQASLKFYLLTGPDAKDARAAQDRIYALDAEKKSAQAAANAPAQQAAQQKADNDRFMQSIEGAYYLCYDGHASPKYMQTLLVLRNRRSQAGFGRHSRRRADDRAGWQAPLFASLGTWLLRDGTGWLAFLDTYRTLCVGWRISAR